MPAAAAATLGPASPLACLPARAFKDLLERAPHAGEQWERCGAAAATHTSAMRRASKAKDTGSVPRPRQQGRARWQPLPGHAQTHVPAQRARGQRSYSATCRKVQGDEGGNASRIIARRRQHAGVRVSARPPPTPSPPLRACPRRPWTGAAKGTFAAPCRCCCPARPPRRRRPRRRRRAPQSPPRRPACATVKQQRRFRRAGVSAHHTAHWTARTPFSPAPRGKSLLARGGCTRCDARHTQSSRFAVLNHSSRHESTPTQLYFSQGPSPPRRTP